MSNLDKALVDVEKVGEIIDGEQMPEAQRQRIKKKIEDLFAKEGEVPIQDLHDKLMAIVAETFPAGICQIVERKIIGAFGNEEPVEAVRQSFRAALEEQADWLKRQAEGDVAAKIKDAEEEREEDQEELKERVEMALKDLSHQTLLDFTGVRESGLTPSERHLIDTNVRRFADQALGST